MIFEKHKNWSLLDPRPVIYYEPSLNEWCVFWNGTFMLYNSALVLAGAMLLNSPSGKEVMYQNDQKFLRMYKAGLFKDIEAASGGDWGGIINNTACSSYYSRKLSLFIRTNLKEYDKIDVWRWFTKRYE